MAIAPDSAANEVAPGEVLAGRYEVLRVLGVGGEGIVVEAIDNRHDRRVAVKVRRVGDAGASDSILNEARALLSLSPHPGLPTVREDVLEHNRYLLVMDWVEGIDLQKVLADGPMRPGRAMVLLGQIASALDHLHAHGLVHGDVKPANILQLPGGRAQLVDLGMAAASLTNGSPGFAAPERGLQAATAAGDVFAFAATAVTMLSGSAPTPVDVGKLAVSVSDTLPEAFRAPLRDALARDPDVRPPSAGALMRTLQQSAPAVMDETPPSFVMTDIVGSTRKWEDQPSVMAAALAAHDRRIEAVVSGHNGTLLHSKGEGDSTVSQFADVADAIEAAAEIQHALTDWDEGVALRLTVRASVHCGAVEERDGQVFGPTLNQAARLRSAGHGGQVLVSEAAVRMVADRLPEDLSLVSLGIHRIRDLHHPEPVYQLAGRSLATSFQPLKTLDRLTNLPHLADTVVGREQELVVVAELLGSSRIVTLTGSGGSGKTRLALQAAGDALGRFAGGIWLVSLATLSEGSGVPRSILDAIGATGGTSDPVAQIGEALRGEPSLILLDNCEHLLGAVAGVVDTLVKCAPTVTVLATSRERLRIDGEVTFPVPLLTLPAEGEDPLSSPAVQLFVRRASQARPGLSFAGRGGEPNLAAASELCRRLDGIPLAIELAASRLSAIPLETLVRSLADQFRLASGGSRAALPRHQSLHATIEWSESLLPEVARTVWRRLTVFRGGFRLDAAISVVCGAGPPADDLEPVDELELIEALTTLVEASILSVADDGRYELLETLREFGAERLSSDGAEHVIALRHARWIDSVTNGGFDGLTDAAAHDQAMHDLEREHTNLVAALSWTMANEPEVGALLAIHSWLHFYTSSRWSESRPFLERSLETLDRLAPREQAALMLCAAHVLAYGGSGERAITLITDGTGRARELNEPILEWIGLVITGAGMRAAVGDIETYRRCMAEAVEIADRLELGFMQATSRLWASWEMPMAEGRVYAEWALEWAETNHNFFVRRQVEESIGWLDPNRTERRQRLERRVAEDYATKSHGIWSEGALAEELVSEAEYDRAIELLRSGLRRNSGGHTGAMKQHWQLVCLCYCRLGQRADAEEAWDQSLRWQFPWPSIRFYEPSVGLEMGWPEVARDALIDLLEMISAAAWVDDETFHEGADRILANAAHYLVLRGLGFDLAGEVIAITQDYDNGYDLPGMWLAHVAVREAGAVIPDRPSKTRRELGLSIRELLLADDVSV